MNIMPLVSVKAFCDYNSMNRRQVMRLVDKGYLPVVWYGKKVFINNYVLVEQLKNEVKKNAK